MAAASAVGTVTKWYGAGQRQYQIGPSNLRRMSGPGGEFLRAGESGLGLGSGLDGQQ